MEISAKALDKIEQAICDNVPEGWCQHHECPECIMSITKKMFEINSKLVDKE